MKKVHLQELNNNFSGQTACGLPLDAVYYRGVSWTRHLEEVSCLRCKHIAFAYGEKMPNFKHDLEFDASMALAVKRGQSLGFRFLNNMTEQEILARAKWLEKQSITYRLQVKTRMEELEASQ